jgi:hypothetical protein
VVVSDLKAAAKTQAQNALVLEFSRREERRRAESIRLYGHEGAHILGTAMSAVEQWDFLLAAYDAALENDGEVPHGFAWEWERANR